jgi:hypothetical protein
MSAYWRLILAEVSGENGRSRAKEGDVRLGGDIFAYNIWEISKSKEVLTAKRCICPNCNSGGRRN